LEQFESREMLTGLDELRASVSDLYDPNEVVVYVDGLETRLNSAEFIQYIFQAGGIDTVSYTPAPVRITTLQPLQLDSLVANNSNLNNSANNKSNLGGITNSIIASVPDSAPQLSDYRQQLFLSPQLNSAQIQSSYFGTLELQQGGVVSDWRSPNVAILADGNDRNGDDVSDNLLATNSFFATDSIDSFYNSAGFGDSYGAAFSIDGNNSLDIVIRNSSASTTPLTTEFDSRGSSLDYDSITPKVDRASGFAIDQGYTYSRFVLLQDTSNFSYITGDSVAPSDVSVFPQPIEINEVATLDISSSVMAADTYEQTLPDAAALMAKMPQHMITPAQQQMIQAVAMASMNTSPTKTVQARLRLTGIVGRTSGQPFQPTLVSADRADSLGNTEGKQITGSSREHTTNDRANQNRIAALLRYVQRAASEEQEFDDNMLDGRVLDEINELARARTEELDGEDKPSDGSVEFEPDHVSSDFVLASLSFFGAGLILNHFSKSFDEEEDRQKGNPRLPR
jgi:hypothetical protein